MKPRQTEFPTPAADPEGPETDRWTIADLIDLEYYLNADEQAVREGPESRRTINERDRTLYLQHISQAVAPAQPHTADHRRASLWYWLKARRAAEEPEVRDLLPGTSFDRAQRLITLGLAGIGFLIGIGVASALLSYEGERPINVSWYIFLLVVVQFLLIGGALVAWLVRRTRPVGTAVRDLTLLGRVIRPLFARVGQWLQRQRIGHASQDAQDQLRSRAGRLKSQYALYGPVSYLPVLVPAQVFGVAFNLGVIATTVSLEWFTDLAFGWASALDVSPQVVYDLARAIAWPWRWLFGEGVGFPSLDQVAGSRILLKDPLFLLDAAHLRSWRWFLVLAVFTYGLLPRLLLLGGSILAQRILLGRLPFTQARTQALYARLITPKVDLGTGVSGHGPEMPIPAPVTHRGPLARPIAGAPSKPAPTTPQAAEAPPQPPAPTQFRAPAAPTKAPAAPTAPPVTAPLARPEVPRAPQAPEPPKPAPVAEPQLRPAPQGVPAAGKVPPSPPSAPVPSGEVRPEPVAGPQPTPEPASVPAPAPEAVPIPEPAPLIIPEPPARPEPIPEQVTPPQPVPEPEAVPQRAAVPGAEVPPRPEPAPVPEPLPPAEPEPEPEPLLELVTALERKPEPAPEPEPEPQPEPEIAAVREATPQPEPVAPATAVPGGIAADSCLVLVHLDVDELIEDRDRPRLAAMLARLTGWRVADSASFGSGTAMTEGVVKWVEGQRWEAPPPRVAVIMDGSQPPITENLRFLRELRGVAGAQAQILLALVGDPEEDDPLPPVRAFDFTDWRRKIDQLVDPYLRLEMLASERDEGDA